MIQPANIEFSSLTDHPEKLRIEAKLDDGQVPVSLVVERGVLAVLIKSFREADNANRFLEQLPTEGLRKGVEDALVALTAVLCHGSHFTKAPIVGGLDAGLWTPPDTSEIPA